MIPVGVVSRGIATRSEKMVNILHAAGHIVGIDTLRRIDSIYNWLNYILRRYERNGYIIYIPTGISTYTPGRRRLSSFDNIDVFEETIDGENTFHAP